MLPELMEEGFVTYIEAHQQGVVIHLYTVNLH